MKKVLVLSEDLDDTSEILDTYEAEGNFDVSLAYSAQDAVDTLRSSHTDLLVFNVNFFSPKKLKAAVDLRSMGVHFPVLSLAKKVEEKAYKQVQNLDNAVLLEKPYREEQLISLSHKMSDGEEVGQRMFPRFSTDELAYIAAYPSDEFSKVSVHNISKGGALIELPDNHHFSPGDLVRFSLSLDQVSKKYKMCARIMWIRDGFLPGFKCFGLKYITEAEILQELLSVG